MCKILKISRSNYYNYKDKIEDKDAHTAQNVLGGDFKATRPLEKLVTDITYLRWGENSVYLSSIMDLHNGEIIAYTLG